MTGTTAVSGSSYTTTSRYQFDSAALIEAAVAAKLATANAYADKIEVNEAKISAYAELQSLLLELQEAAQAIRSPKGTIDSADDVFLDRTAYLYSPSNTTATNLMEATVEEGTDIGSHTIVIEQIATAEKIGSGDISSRTEALGYSGTFTVGAEDGSATEITVTGDMSLNEIVKEINDVAATTGVTASVIKVDDDSYMMVLTAANTGQDISLTDPDGVLTSLGFLASDGTFANELRKNQSAIVAVDGVTIERESNQIDDALDGITLQLYAADPDTTLTLETAADLSGIQDAITAFVDAYNALRDFIVTNQTVTSAGVAADDAVLFADSTLRSISAAVAAIITDDSGGYSLADIGLKFDSSNHLTLNQATLGDALVNNLEMIQALFAYQYTTSDGDLALLSHDDTQDSLSFTLDITVGDDGTITAASVAGDSSLFTISGNTISGAEGSIYEGLKFVYTGGASESIDVEINQGLADRLYYVLKTAADETDSTLTDVIGALEETNAELEKRIATVKARAADYEEYLTEKYSRIQATLSAAESILALLEALNDSDD